MALIIAIVNAKGGVSKTATTSALGSIYAQGGNKVLMVDLDIQSNLTYSFIDIENNRPDRYIYDAIRERKGLPQVCIQENLYIVPSGLEMALVDPTMYSMRRREFILQDLVRPVEDKYDIILLDCPPSLALMTMNALAIADRVVVPMVADQLSYYGLKIMKAYVDSMTDINANLCINDVFFTRYDNREKLTRQWEPIIREEFGDVVMKSYVHKNVKVSEAVSALCSVVNYCPECQGAIDYVNLAKELMERINNQ